MPSVKGRLIMPEIRYSGALTVFERWPARYHETGGTAGTRLRRGQDLGKSEARPENREAKPNGNRHNPHDSGERKAIQRGENAMYGSRGTDQYGSKQSVTHKPTGRIETQTSGTELTEDGTELDRV